MNRGNISPSPKELIFALAINISAGIIIYLITRNPLTTVIALLIIVPSIIGAYILYKTTVLIKESGLKRMYIDSPDPTPLLKQYFESSKRIRLLAIRGARMLGTDRSLINYIIKELPKGWSGNIQVLLLDPHSVHLEQRAAELGDNPAQFAAVCRGSIRNILSLRQKYDIGIELRLYDKKPILRAIIFDDRALLSYYIGKEGHIPIQYEIRSGENSLLRMLDLIYDDLWNESESVEGNMEDSS